MCKMVDMKQSNMNSKQCMKFVGLAELLKHVNYWCSSLAHYS